MKLSQAESIEPIEFTDVDVGKTLVRYAGVKRDIVIQILKGTGGFPPYIAQRAAKALVQTVGEPAMDSIQIEYLENPLIDGGSSVYIKCFEMNTDVIKSILFPKFLTNLEETMQEA